MRQNQSAGSFGNSGADLGRQPTRSRSTQDMYTKQELEASAASKEDFFARRMAKNESKPQGIPPPSQGGKYVGFESTPPPSANRNNGAAQGGDVMQVVSQGLGCLSLVAASAAQSAASVAQVGTKEIQSKDAKVPSLIDHGTWIALCSLCSSNIMVKLVVIIHFTKLT